MRLQDVYDQLINGELSQIFMGEDLDDLGCFSPETLSKLWGSTYLGLTELHKRFPLREMTQTLAILPDKKSYLVDIAFAVSNTASTEPDKYILDSASPFEDDLLKIERVYDAEGNELTLNKHDNIDSVRTPTYNSVLIPDSLEGATFDVVYRATHPQVNVSMAKSSPEMVVIHLPVTHLEPLLFYIAARIMTPSGMNETFHDGNNYVAKFEASCQKLIDLNLQVDSSGENTRFAASGFV